MLPCSTEQGATRVLTMLRNKAMVGARISGRSISDYSNRPASVDRKEVGDEAHSLAQALLAKACFGYA